MLESWDRLLSLRTKDRRRTDMALKLRRELRRRRLWAVKGGPLMGLHRRPTVLLLKPFGDVHKMPWQIKNIAFMGEGNGKSGKSTQWERRRTWKT